MSFFESKSPQALSPNSSPFELTLLVLVELSKRPIKEYGSVLARHFRINTQDPTLQEYVLIKYSVGLLRFCHKMNISLTTTLTFINTMIRLYSLAPHRTLAESLSAANNSMLLITEQWSFYQQTNQSLDPLEVIISNPSPLQPIMTPNRQPQSFSLSTPMIDDDAYSFLQHTPQHSPATSQNDSPSPEQLTRSTVKQSEIVLLLEKATTQLIKLYLSLKLCDRTALSPLFRSLSSASFALVSHIQTLQVKLKSKRKEMIRWHRQNPNVDANNSPPHVRALKSEYDCLVAQIELLQCKQNILEHESVMVEDQINTFLKKAEMGSGQTASQTARPPEHASTPTSPPRNVSILTTPQTTKAPIASPPERKRTPPLPSFPLQTPQNSKARRPAQTVQVIRPQTALRSTNRAQLTTTSSAVNRSASTPKRSMYPPQRSWKENTIEVDSPTRITCFTTMPRNRVADEMKTPLRARTAEDPDVNVTPKTQLQQRRAHLKQLEKPKTEMSMRILQEKFESIEVELYTQKPQGTNRPARRQAMEKGGLN